jgi:hypothetical protein
MKKFAFIRSGYDRTTRVQKTSYGCVETGEVLTSFTKTIFKKSSTQDVERYEIVWTSSGRAVFVRVFGVQTVDDYPKQKGFLFCEVN